MNLGVLVIIAIIVFGIGGGGFYLLYLKTRPKKQTWNARVYQLSDAVKEPTLNDKGEIISDLQLKDLKPYALDVIEKIDKEPGITVYKLQKIGKPTPAIEGDVVDYWGMDKKEVTVLMHGGNFVILKKGYDQKTGNLVYQPMSLSRINMLKSEIALRKDRIQKEKDILQAITPWIVAGICILGLIGISYIMVSGFITMSEHSREAIIHSDETLLTIERMRQGVSPEPHDLGQQTQEVVKPTPPLIEG